MKWLIAYLAVGLPFGLLDALWLRWAGPKLYRPAIGELLAPSFRPLPAAIFYLAYVAAIVWFAVRPGLAGGIGSAALNGALLGAIAYAAYDLTNQATMKVWPVHVTLIDIAWGAFATAAASTIACWAAVRFA
jgi:uncharacterized membrane protein